MTATKLTFSLLPFYCSLCWAVTRVCFSLTCKHACGHVPRGQGLMLYLWLWGLKATPPENSHHNRQQRASLTAVTPPFSSVYLLVVQLSLLINYSNIIILCQPILHHFFPFLLCKLPCNNVCLCIIGSLSLK